MSPEFSEGVISYHRRMQLPRGWVAVLSACALGMVAGCVSEDDADELAQVSQAVGEPPINSIPPPQTVNEDSPLFFSDTAGNALTISDADNATGVVQFIVNNGTFTLGATTDLSVTGNGTANVIVSGTLQAINDGLSGGTNGSKFQPTANFSGPTTLDMNSSDSNGESDFDTLSINVTAFNDAPVHVVPSGTQAATEDVPRAFTLSVTDVDVGTAPVLMTLTASNSVLMTLPSTVGLAFTGGDGTDDTAMSFSGQLPDINAALNGLVLTPPLNFIGNSTLIITSNDQGATGAGPIGSDNDVITLTWAAVNDAPVNVVPGAQTLVEEGTKTFSAAGGNAFSVSDVDASTTLVQITLSAADGTLTIGNPGIVNFTNGDGTADASMTFNGVLSNLNSALDGTVFTPDPNFNGATTVTLTTNDLGNVGSGGARTDTDVVSIDVGAVNDAPVNAVPGAQLTGEDVARVFSTANANAITVADADASTLQVTLTATSGTATLAGTSGLTFFAGDGAADVTMTFSGTASAINTALAGVRYTPNANVSGSGSLAIVTSDLGATGTGGTLTDSDTIAITIAPVNDPPTAANDTGTLAEDAGATPFTVLPNDTITPDTGETLTVTAVGTPLHGTATTNGTTITYTPAANYNGTDSVGYTISDGGLTATATLSLTITPVNDDPTAVDDTFAVLQNSTGNLLSVLTNDLAAPDTNDTLTVSAVGTPAHGTATISAGTRISYTPTAGYAGPDSFTYTLADGNGGFDTATVTIDVTAVITEPANSLPAAQVTVEDTPLFFSAANTNAITVSDSNNTSLTVQIIVTNGVFTLGGTSGLTVSGNGTASVTASGAIAQLNTGLNNARFTPTANYYGPAQLTINSSDTSGETDLDTLTLTVTSFNDAPVNTVPSGTQAASEDTPKTFSTVSITDVDLEGADLLVTLTANNGTTITLGGLGGLTFTAGDGTADTTMTFRGSLPSVNVALNGLTITAPANYIGPSTLVITTDDEGHTGAGTAGQDTDTISLTWSASNDAPINAVPAALSVVEDATLTLSGGTVLTVSDADVAAGTMQVTLGASTGTVTLGNPGLVTFTNGDGTADATMTFSGTLANVNSALNATQYAPPANFNGAATLTMTSSDLGNVGSGGAKLDTDVVAITVTAANDAPLNGVPPAQVANEDIARIFSTTNGNAITVSDPDATSVQVTLTASNGTASLGGVAGLSFLAGDGTTDATMTFAGTVAAINTALNGARFTPAADVSGTGVLSIATSDLGATGAGGPKSDEDSITISITEVNDPPTAVSDVGTVNEDATATAFAVLVNDTFVPDTGETLTVTAVGTPLHGAATFTGTSVSYTPTADYNGTDSVSYTISDGRGLTSTATLSLTVTSVNDNPTAVDDTFSVITNSSSNSFAVLTNDSIAPDVSETLTISAVGTPAHGTATAISGNTRVSYTPTPGYSGPDTFTYTASDGNGGTDVATVTVDVVAVITRPVNALPGPQTIVEDGLLTFGAATTNAITVSDSDNTSLTVQLTVTNGVWDFASTTGLSITAGADNSATITVSGPVTTLNTRLDGARYVPTANYHGPAQLVVSTSDTNGESDLDVLVIAVTSSNDVPVNTVPAGTQTATEDSPKTFATIQCSDVDLEGADLKVTLTANNGTVITLAATSGLVFTEGDGISDLTMTFTGSLPSINVALNGLSITAPANYIGPSTLVIKSNDQGYTGAGIAGEDTDTVTLNWVAVNDSPVNTVPGAQTIVEEGTFTFASGNALSVSDTDLGAGQISVQLTATNGTLTLGDPASVSFTAGDGLADTTMTFRAVLGTLNAAMNGTVFTPTANFAGNATVTMLSNDLGNTGGTSTNDSDVVTITVTAVNDAPTITVPVAQSTNEDVQRVFSSGQGNQILIADVDAAAVQVTLNASNGAITLQGTSGLTFQAGDGTTDATMTFTGPVASCVSALNGVRFIPTTNFVGTGTLFLSVTDLGGTGTGGPLTDEDAVTINVVSVNDNPDAVNDSAGSIVEDSTPVVLDVLANDTTAPDTGEALTITATSTPAHGAVSITGGGTTVTYTPTADYFGADSFTYTVSDGNTGSDTATVSITMTAVNDAPNAVDDAFTVAESSTNNAMAVRSNDSFLPDATETLTVSAVGTPAHGTVVITGSGGTTAVSYTPTPAYNGADSFTYTLSDPSGLTDTATVSVTVTSVSTTPNAIDDTMTVAEDGSGIKDVLANDAGLGDAPITVIAAVPAPLHGSITVLGDNTIQYTPVADYAGSDTFGYRVSDVDTQFDTATVTVTVTAADDQPVAVADTDSTVEDTSKVIDVLANDTKVVDLPVVVTVTTPPAHGTATPSGTSISYVPAADYAGPDAFNYTVTDQDGDSSSAQVTMTVTPVNDAPVAVDDYAAVHVDEAVDVAVLDNDTDADANTLVVQSITTPSNGAATLNGDGTVHYVPPGGFMGSATFSYTVSDGAGGTDTGDVVVAVGVDTDGDGLLDVDEVSVHGTDPQNADTDGDGLDDGDEVMTTMTDALDDDTDDDGLFDGTEDADADGVVDAGETDANNVDTDDDGVQDGTESGLDAPEGDDTDAGVFVADADPASMTDPLDPDTDGGGTSDGDEDQNGDGAVDSGETDPNDPEDDPGPPDGDDDGVPDADDNCPDDFNPNQVDEDGNGIGDTCEAAPPEPGGCCDTGGATDPGAPAALALITMLLIRAGRRSRRGSDRTDGRRGRSARP